MRVACVRSGTLYPVAYVERLESMLRRHTSMPFDFVVLTDRPDEVAHLDADVVDVSWSGLEGWWPKMLLFDPEVRGPGRVVYFDLDTVVAGNVDPLLLLDVPFGICANFTRAAGNLAWPCRYGSCVMTFAGGWGEGVFREFWEWRAQIMAACGRYGDQVAVEKLVPDAALLQDHLPPGFFRGRRELSPDGPDGASVLVFAGPHKPHNTPLGWVKELWR